MRFNTSGYWDGHQHANNIFGLFGLVKVLFFHMKYGQSIKIKKERKRYNA